MDDNSLSFAVRKLEKVISKITDTSTEIFHETMSIVEATDEE
jgi:hypothetical protein